MPFRWHGLSSLVGFISLQAATFGLVKKSYVFCRRRYPISPVHNSYQILCRLVLTPRSLIALKSLARSSLNLEDSAHPITSLQHKLEHKAKLYKINDRPLEIDTLACWLPPCARVLSFLKSHSIVSPQSYGKFCSERSKTQLMMNHIPKL
jgi:hypothetical protein